jgi:hypothetical protein
MPPKRSDSNVRSASVGGRSKTAVVERTSEESIRAYLNFVADPSSSLDAREIARLEKLVSTTTDPLEKLRVAAQLEQAKAPDGSALQTAFVREAKRWADAEGIPVGAFRQLGVPDDVLRKAGLIRGTKGTSRRRSAERTSRRVTVDDIKAWALAQPEVFTIKDVTQAIGGSLVTANKALQELVVDGTLQNLGPAADHKGPGRAPARFTLTKKRKAARS